MTVADLIDRLKEMPQDAEAYVATNCHGCWGPVASVRRDDRGMVVVEDEER